MANIWVAAGDGDLDRVRVLIEQHSLSPNMPDPNSYTPMHAAASYGHIHVLEYLISRGGDVNITDSDGDTPLYTVENVETARFLVEHGAVVARQNLEGISAIEHLTEDFPQIADYLRSTLDPSTVPLAQVAQSPSQHSQNAASEQLTSALMTSVEEIMRRAEAEGRDPEEDLRRLVSRTVLEGVATGFEMSIDDDTRRAGDGADDNNPTKRARTDNNP
ncbi:ankyrin [Agrocybe pediades]|nr:ankyrin [Agrocybe pediades]